MDVTSRSLRAIDRAHRRDFSIAGHWVNSYKVFLCLGVYAAILVSSAVAAAGGLSPLRLGAGLLVCALVGMIAARLYHLAVNARAYRAAGFPTAAWNTARGGWSVFGGLVVFPFSMTLETWTRIPLPLFWDHMAIAIVVGGPLIRFGCVCNGCCVGRASDRWFARAQHDTRGRTARRVPVQWLEIGWWLLAGIGLLWLWSFRFPPGSYALGVLAWYGLGRVWLEPLRETSEVVNGHVRVNRLVAALLTMLACGGLLRQTLVP